MTDDVALGRLLGRREAFNAVAARCTAAEVLAMRQIRERKLYLNHAEDWDQFCAEHLHINKQAANRLIRLLEEFGPTYFEIAQFTRVSPATYRALAPSIRGQSLHHDGEAIALIPENAGNVVAAVADIRKAAEMAPRAERKEAPLHRRCIQLAAEIQSAALGSKDDGCVRAAIQFLRTRLREIEAAM